MDIKKKFLELTSRTYPHGTEHELFDLVPQDLEMDDFGNLFTKIGDSDVMFTSHFDTATSALTDINHVFDGNIIKTDGKSILGADDKAGVVIMMYMIENKIPGLYYFFLGEEVGCVGSGKVSELHSIEKLPYINKVISFDRRGTDSVITFQGGTRCSSDEFANSLSAELNKNSNFSYKPDPTGVYTDSAQFTKIYPECTNISVGYYSEHTFSERQDIDHLIKLADACLMVDWKSLPTNRDMSKTEYSDYGYESYGFGFGSYSRGNRNYSDVGWGGRSGYWDDDQGIHTTTTSSKKIYFHDKEFNYFSSFLINQKTMKISGLDISKERILHEECLIFDFLNQLDDLNYDDMSWNGSNLTVKYSDKNPTYVSRDELMEYISELDLSKYLHVDYDSDADYDDFTPPYRSLLN